MTQTHTFGYDKPLLQEAGEGIGAGVVGSTVAYTLLEQGRSLDPADLDQFWERISAMYSPMPEHIGAGLPTFIEHAKHVGELAVALGPAAAGFFVAINLSDRSLAELGDRRYGRAAMLFAGSLACYAASGAWRPALQLASNIITRHSDVIHDPQTLTMFGAAGVWVGIGTAINLARDGLVGVGRLAYRRLTKFTEA